MPRPTLLRLAAVAAAGATLLPALPAAAGGPPDGAGRPSTPVVRGLDLACPTDRVSGGGFADTAGSVHASAVDCLAFYGVTKGSADGTFGAGKAVTRGQLATFLARVLDASGVELPTGAADAFSDDDGSAHEDSLDALAELEVVNGAGDGTVSPEAPVRRDQMASFLVRLLELVTDEQLAATLEDYFDDTDGNVHRGPINALAGLGIAAGRSKGIFDPSSEVKREQMAAFLMRLIDRLVEKGDVRVPASLQLSAKKVSPGDLVTGTVVGDGLTAVSLAGCGFDDVVPVQTATATATTVEFTFDLVVPDAWPAEVEDEDADEDAEEAAEEAAEADDDAAEVVTAGRGEDRRTSNDEKCEFAVLVTFADGDTDELEGELKYRDADEGSDEDEDEDSDEDDADDSESEVDDDEPVSTEPTV